MNKVDQFIELLSSRSIFGICMVGYLIGFLLFGLIMGLGFVAAAVTHSALFVSRLDK